MCEREIFEVKTRSGKHTVEKYLKIRAKNSEQKHSIRNISSVTKMMVTPGIDDPA
jgi:hypothetical protein